MQALRQATQMNQINNTMLNGNSNSAIFMPSNFDYNNQNAATSLELAGFCSPSGNEL